MRNLLLLIIIGTFLALLPTMAYEVYDDFMGASVLFPYQGGTGAQTFTEGECIIGHGSDPFTSQACGGGGGGLEATAFSATSPLQISTTSTTVDYSILMASSTANGYLSSTDWNTFNDKIGTTTGDWIGTFDGQEGVWYLDRANHTGSISLSDLTLATGNFYIGDGSNNPIATNSLFMATDGNVGIATTTPAYELDVNGDIQAQNIYPADNGSYELGISETGAFNNAHFKDETGQYFSMRDIAFEQRNVVDDLPYMKIETFQTVVGGVWTVGYRTAGADAGLDLVVNIARKVYRVGTTTLTVDASAYAGTDANPNDVSIIVIPNGGTPILYATTTAHSDITIEHVDVVTIKVGKLSDSSITTYGSSNYKTQAYEVLAKLLHRVTHRNLPYISGMAITSADDDVTIGTGEAMWLVDEFDTTAEQVTVDTMFYLDSSGDYATSTAWEFDGNYSTGEAISANKFFNVYLGIVPTNYNNTENRIMALVQRGDILDSEYKDMEDCIADDDGARVTQPTDSVLATGFTPVARVCVKQIATNALQAWPSGLYHDDVRIGAESVGAGGAITSAFIDNEFTIQDDGNPTALIAFQVSGVTPGNTRTLTVQDSDGTIAYSADLHSAVTLAGQDYLTLSSQEITAGEIEPDDLAGSDFGDFTCNGTICTLDAVNGNLTQLANVTVLGTIATGVWNGTAIDIGDYTNLSIGATGLVLTGDSIELDTGYIIPLTASTTEYDLAYKNGGCGYSFNLASSSSRYEATATGTINLTGLPGAGTVVQMWCQSDATAAGTSSLEAFGTYLECGSGIPTNTTTITTPSAATTTQNQLSFYNNYSGEPNETTVGIRCLWD